MVPAEYAYAVAVNRVKPLFDKITSVGVPPKVDAKWLNQLGFSSSNDRRMIAVLRQLGFIDGSGVPTQLWRDYRGTGARAALGRGIRSGYSDLFHTYPDAFSRPSADIANFIRSNTGLGGEAVSKTVVTFKTLVELADFDGTDPNAANDARTHDVLADEPGVEKASQGANPGPREQTTHVTVNVNLQLTLPESTDAAVYEALFGALARHVLSGGTSVA